MALAVMVSGDATASVDAISAQANFESGASAGSVGEGFRRPVDVTGGKLSSPTDAGDRLRAARGDPKNDGDEGDVVQVEEADVDGVDGVDGVEGNEGNADFPSGVASLPELLLLLGLNFSPP